MDTSEATNRFRSAGELFDAQRYGDALRVLDELDRIYPNTKNIMFPRACCLEKLGRLTEAEQVCDALIAQFNLPRATALKQAIAARKQNTSNYLDNLDILDLGPPPRRTPLPHPSTDWNAVLKVGLIVVGVLVAIGLLSWAIYNSQSGEANTPVIAKSQGAPGAEHSHAPFLSVGKNRTYMIYGNRLTWWGNALVRFIINVPFLTLNLLLTLWIVQKLPRDTWGENFVQCFGMSVLCSALATIPILGPIVSILTIRQNYGLRYAGFLVLFLVSLVTGVFLFLIPLSLMMFGTVQLGRFFQ